MTDYLDIHSYVPEPEQKKIHALIALNRYSWIMGGFRSGKTRAAIEEDIDACQSFPGMVILVTRKFHEDLEKTTKQEFYQYCDPRLLRGTEDGKDIAVFKNGSRVIFRGLYSRSSLQRSKLGSLNIGRVHAEEASEIELNDFLDLQGRLSLTTIPENQRKIYFCANPPTKDHWAYDVFEMNRKPGLRDIIKVSTKANARYLPSTYIKDLQESYGAQPGWLSRFFDGNWGFTPQGDPIFPEFSDIYIDNSISFNKGQTVYRAWDFGWHHPAVVWFQIGPDQDINILKEKMGNKIYLKDFAPDVIRETNDMFPNAEIVDICDDAGTQHKDDGMPSIQVLEDPNGPFKLKMRYRHSYVSEGLELIRGKMKEMIGMGDKARPAFKIHGDNCPILVEGMRGGCCREGDEIIKDGYYEHILDALREGMINTLASRSSLGSAGMARDFKIRTPSYNFKNKMELVGAR